jgi:hypothetical protein
MASPPWARLRDLEYASLQLERDDAEEDKDYMTWLKMLNISKDDNTQSLDLAMSVIPFFRIKKIGLNKSSLKCRAASGSGGA